MPVMKKIGSAVALCCLCAVLSPAVIAAGDGTDDVFKMEIGRLLDILKHPGGGETWGKFDGELMHRRTGGEVEKVPFYFAVTIRKQRMNGQIIFDNSEGYNIGQNFTSGIGMVVPLREGGYGEKAMMSRFGVSPSDLTMSFLHYPFLSEEGVESFRMLSCRKLRFAVPEEEGGGSVLVWVTAYFMPIKAEFFRPGETAPYRTVEIDAFGSKNGLYYAESLNIYGPGWRTKINFSKSDAGLNSGGIPADLYRK